MPASDQVIVVGGGPAGLAAAIALRARNFAVLVVDGARPPIEKVCGEGLLPETLESLRAIGIDTGKLPGVPFRGVRYLARQQQAQAEFPHSAALGITRSKLHQAMLAAATDCGAEFLWQAPVTGLAAEGITVGDRALSAKWIIGADGHSSRIRKWARFETRSQSPQRFAFRQHFRAKPWTDFLEVYWSTKSQAYVTVVGEREICVVVMSRDPHFRMSDALRDFPQLAARLAGCETLDKERGAVSRNRILQQVTRDNIALVGDASGTVDAITGEGLGLAFRQALALADALASGDLSQYEAAHRRLRRKPRVMSSVLLAVGGSEFLQRRGIAALSARPALFATLVAAHAGKSSALDMAGAGLKLGWSFLTT